MKLSELFGKTIESVDKKIRGVILGISCVEDRIDGYICCDERENEFFAESLGSRLGGNQATFARTGKASRQAQSFRLGRAVFSDGGKYLGRIEDCTVRANAITKVHVGKRKYSPEQLIFGDVVIVKSGAAIAEVAAKDMFIGAVCQTERPQ